MYFFFQAEGWILGWGGVGVWGFFFFFQAEDGIRDVAVTGVQTCALPILGKTLEQLGEILTRYPTKQAALLPALWLVQEARGWISDRNMAEVAEVLGLTRSEERRVGEEGRSRWSPDH